MRLRGLAIVCCAAALLLGPAPSVGAQDKPTTKPQSQPAPAGSVSPEHKPGNDRLSVTEHTITVAGGEKLNYRATTGTLAMKDDAGKHKADLFFVAYEKTPVPDDRTTRPITYVFNGGPGAAAVWLHIGTAGPKRLKLTETGEVPPAPHGLVDNEYTWLRGSDLVFIDPVNTGYSRPAPGEEAKQFFGVDNDVRWVGEFIRLYTTRYQRWASPKFLAGESYGTTRAAALSGYLQGDLGISLNGIVLVSAVLDFATLNPSEGKDTPYVLFLPSFTAIAGHHNQLPPAMQKDVPAAVKEAERWAVTDYVAALAQGDGLPEEKRKATAAKLAELTGLKPDVIDKADLRISPGLFRAALLEDDRLVIGRFDGRITGYDPRPLDRQPAFDPSLSAFLGAYGGAFNAYARAELGFESDLTYEILNDVQPWDFGPPGGGPLYVADRLRNAMAGTPGLRVLVAGGYHDLATPYFATRYTVQHMNLGPKLMERVQERLYPGGHMMYHRLESLKALNEDVHAFVVETTKR